MTRSIPVLTELLMLHSFAEQEKPTLAELDRSVVEDAVDAIDAGKAALKADPGYARVGLEPLESLMELLAQVRRFRIEKLLRCPVCPAEALPVERLFHGDIRSAIAELECDWPGHRIIIEGVDDEDHL